MDMKSNESFHILFFDGARHVETSLDIQLQKLFPNLNIHIVNLIDNEEFVLPNQLSIANHKNLFVIGYSLGARRALDWAKNNSFTGTIYLLDPECWKPSQWYQWATQNKLGRFLFLFLMKKPSVLNLIAWILMKRDQKYVRLFIKNKDYRFHLYQDWLAAARYDIIPIEDLGILKSRLTVITSGETFFLRYIPLHQLEQQRIPCVTLSDSSHRQLWKYFLADKFNPSGSVR